VVFADEIHSARFVTKVHTSSVGAFQSRSTGPLGWVTEGHPVIATRPATRLNLDVPSDVAVPPVALLRLSLDDDGRMLTALASLGFAGAVVEGFGGGHVTPAMVPLMKRLAVQMPIVLASRTGSGEVLSSSYRYPGSEIELLEAGLIRAGSLDGLKARVVLAMCLAAGLSPHQIAAAFEAIGMTGARPAPAITLHLGEEGPTRQ
jgi:L-asparaginase